jgi:hypothetical protein
VLKALPAHRFASSARLASTGLMISRGLPHGTQRSAYRHQLDAALQPRRGQFEMTFPFASDRIRSMDEISKPCF